MEDQDIFCIRLDRVLIIVYTVGELLHMVLIIHGGFSIIDLCRLAMPYAGFVPLYATALVCFC